ncbi:cupin domain-containing protein [Kitasatospora sp. NPDC048365]|uniref:cupin domain-containing protein n=1 Tax=Kitasatospora sp. NPDC048365 TaxID=3364050 RepID=UPI0037170506
MILVPLAVPDRAPDLRLLAATGHGTVAARAVPAGGRAEFTAGAGETVLVLIGGRARLAPPGGETVGPGGGAHLPPGARVALTAVGGPAVVLTATAHGGADPAARGSAAPRPLAPTADGDGARALAEGGGHEGMGVRWLATADTVGTRRLTLATSVFTPGGSHRLHRHPAADEFFLVLTGGGEHLTGAGPVRLAAGDLAVVPVGEWHGYRTDPSTTTTALYGYLGAPDLRSAGYLTRPGS